MCVSSINNWWPSREPELLLLSMCSVVAIKQTVCKASLGRAEICLPLSVRLYKIKIIWPVRFMLTVMCYWTLSPQPPIWGLLKGKSLLQTPAPSILIGRAGIVPNHMPNQMHATEKISIVDNGTGYAGVMQQLS